MTEPDDAVFRATVRRRKKLRRRKRRNPVMRLLGFGWAVLTHPVAVFALTVGVMWHFDWFTIQNRLLLGVVLTSLYWFFKP